MNIVALLAGLLSGIIASMGMGGGAVLLIYLTVFAGVEQIAAQGINLLFFIPIGAASVVIYIWKKKIDFKKTVPIALCGVPGAAVGLFLTSVIDSAFLAKIFGGFLILIGLKEIFCKKSK